MHLPAATNRTQVMLSLRFADGFGTIARSTPSTGSPTAGSTSRSSALVNERVARGVWGVFSRISPRAGGQ